jgi:hypothetical protein
MVARHFDEIRRRLQARQLWRPDLAFLEQAM